MDQIAFFSLYLSLAFLFAMALVVVVGGTLHLGNKRSEGFLMYFFVPLLISMALITLTSGRDLAYPEDVLAGVATVGGLAKWVQRLTILFLLAASVERIFSFVVARHDARKPHGLMLAYALFWLGTVAIPAAFGTRPTLSQEYVYSLLIGLAALLSTEDGAERAIKVARNMLVLFMCAGLILIVVKGKLVIGPYTSSLIPGFAKRYWGLAAGPNAMGPLAVLGLICLWCYPLQRRWLQNGAWAVALGTLLLTQSKTSWLAAVACFAVLLILQSRGRMSGYLSNPRVRSTTLAVLIGTAVVIMLLMLVATSGVMGPKIHKFFATKLGADIATMTGRNEIWAIALSEWRQNLLFGYGPSIWDPLYRYQIGNVAAFHAHNQVINILAASGLVGLVAFLGYMAMLLRRFAQRFACYNGFAAALLVLILIRSISEVPLNLQGFGNESLFHILLLMALAGARPQLQPQAVSKAVQSAMPVRVAGHG